MQKYHYVQLIFLAFLESDLLSEQTLTDQIVLKMFLDLRNSIEDLKYVFVVTL